MEIIALLAILFLTSYLNICHGSPVVIPTKVPAPVFGLYCQDFNTMKWCTGKTRCYDCPHEGPNLSWFGQSPICETKCSCRPARPGCLPQTHPSDWEYQSCFDLGHLPVNNEAPRAAETGKSRVKQTKEQGGQAIDSGRPDLKKIPSVDTAPTPLPESVNEGTRRSNEVDEAAEAKYDMVCESPDADIRCHGPLVNVHCDGHGNLRLGPSESGLSPVVCLTRCKCQKKKEARAVANAGDDNGTAKLQTTPSAGPVSNAAPDTNDNNEKRSHEAEEAPESKYNAICKNSKSLQNLCTSPNVGFYCDDEGHLFGRFGTDPALSRTCADNCECKEKKKAREEATVTVGDEDSQTETEAEAKRSLEVEGDSGATKYSMVCKNTMLDLCQTPDLWMRCNANGHLVYSELASQEAINMCEDDCRCEKEKRARDVSYDADGGAEAGAFLPPTDTGTGEQDIDCDPLTLAGFKCFGKSRADDGTDKAN